MAAMVLHTFIFLVGFLLCSGRSVEVLYDGRSLSSFTVDSLQLIEHKNASRIQIFDENIGLLSPFCRSDIGIDLYMSLNSMLGVTKSRALAVSWVQRTIASISGCLKVTSIILDGKLMTGKYLRSLLTALRAIHSALVSLDLDQSIELSASFSLSFIEDCYRIPQKPSFQKFRAMLEQVMDFLQKPNCSLSVCVSCKEELGIGDHLKRLKTKALLTVFKHELPLKIYLRSQKISSYGDTIELNKQLGMGWDNWIGNRSISFFIEKAWINEFEQQELELVNKKLFPSHRELIGNELYSFDSMFGRDVATPSGAVSIINPTTPTMTPVVNPIDSPSSPTLTPPLIPTTPTTTPTTPSPPMSGAQWCVASQSASETALQVALDYACGYGGADCSAIQKGASCFLLDTIRDHASYAFNNYYQKNPVPTSCNFGGTAVLTSTDPSTSTCHYTPPSSSSSPPTMNTNPPPALSPPTSGNGTDTGTGSTIYGTEPPGSSEISAAPRFNMLPITLTCLLAALKTFIYI